MSAEPGSFPYATFLNILYPQLERVDVPSLVSACKDRWYNQTLCQVNGSVVRLGVMQGEYHWHEHPDDDEFFFVLEGTFFVSAAPAVQGRVRSAERRAPRHDDCWI